MPILFVIIAVLLLGYLLWKYFGQSPPPPLSEDEELLQEFADTVAIVAPPPVVVSPPLSPSPMAQFAISYDIVKGHEGGYQNNPNDGGNFNSRGENVGTNWGINAQVYEEYLGQPPTSQQMRNMPRETAMAIFKRNYWDKMNGDNIRDQRVADILFDGFVNHGRWGIQMMQRAVNVAADGLVGAVTTSAINNADPRTLFNTYRAIRRNAYHDLVRRRPWMKVFLNGWLQRIDSFQYGTAAGGATVAALGLAALAFYFIKQ